MGRAALCGTVCFERHFGYLVSVLHAQEIKYEDGLDPIQVLTCVKFPFADHKLVEEGKISQAEATIFGNAFSQTRRLSEDPE